MLRENIKPLEEAGPVWPMLKELQAQTFNFSEDLQPFPVYGPMGNYLFDENGNQVVEYRDVNEAYSRGIQLLIDAEKAKTLYPEGVINQNGEDYVRMDLLTVLLFQSVKEIYKEFSDRIAALEVNNV